MLEYKFSKIELPEFIKNAIDEANFFYSDAYIAYLKNKGGKIVFIYSNDYILLAVINTKYIFKYCFFPSEQINIRNSSETSKHFLDTCMDLLKSVFKVQWLVATGAHSFFTEYPTKSIRIPFGSHVINLNEEEEVIWSKIHSKHKNSIRKAEKSNLEVCFGSKELLEDYLVLDKETWARSKKRGFGKEYYEDILNFCSSSILIVIVYHESIPQAGAIFYFNKKMSYYMYGASCNNSISGSMNLLHWNTILYMKNKSTSSYSFVGCRINEDVDSKYHGIQRFKERFGGDLISGFMFKVVFNNLYYSIAKFALKIMKQPIHDAIDQEKHKWISIN